MTAKNDNLPRLEPAEARLDATLSRALRAPESACPADLRDRVAALCDGLAPRLDDALAGGPAPEGLSARVAAAVAEELAAHDAMARRLSGALAPAALDERSVGRARERALAGVSRALGEVAGGAPSGDAGDEPVAARIGPRWVATLARVAAVAAFVTGISLLLMMGVVESNEQTRDAQTTMALRTVDQLIEGLGDPPIESADPVANLGLELALIESELETTRGLSSAGGEMALDAALLELELELISGSPFGDVVVN